MASKYIRENSAFWWIKYRDETGKICREPTTFRHGDSMGNRGAAMEVAKRTLEEKTVRVVNRDAHAFDHWVETWLKVTYANSPRTLTKYLGSWKIIYRWLLSRGLVSPIHLKRDHAMEFILWRQEEKDVRLSGKKLCGRNSALMDLKILRMIMFEAEKRSYIKQNPISRLKFKADRAREKPEFSAEQIATIREALKEKPDWMKHSFEIALYQGCRFSETAFPLKDVNLKDGTLTLTIKGNRRHTTMLHPQLRPLLEGLLAEGKKVSLTLPSINAARDWSRFFRKLKMKGWSFHCTRVTAITMLARSGKVNEQQAMAYIGHQGREIHRIYQRLKAKDLSSCTEAISF